MIFWTENLETILLFLFVSLFVLLLLLFFFFFAARRAKNVFGGHSRNFSAKKYILKGIQFE